MTSIIEYWKEIVVAIGAVGSFIVGRKSAKILERKQQSDAISIMQSTYDTFLKHYDEQYQKLVSQVDRLQKQFTELSLSYAKEIEVSQNWEKLHRELQIQYTELDKKYVDLEKLYEKLKADFEKYKKQTK